MCFRRIVRAPLGTVKRHGRSDKPNNRSRSNDLPSCRRNLCTIDVYIPHTRSRFYYHFFFTLRRRRHTIDIKSFLTKPKSITQYVSVRDECILCHNGTRCNNNNRIGFTIDSRKQRTVREGFSRARHRSRRKFTRTDGRTSTHFGKDVRDNDVRRIYIIIIIWLFIIIAVRRHPSKGSTENITIIEKRRHTHKHSVRTGKVLLWRLFVRNRNFIDRPNGTDMHMLLACSGLPKTIFEQK